MLLIWLRAGLGPVVLAAVVGCGGCLDCFFFCLFVLLFFFKLFYSAFFNLSFSTGDSFICLKFLLKGPLNHISNNFKNTKQGMLSKNMKQGMLSRGS